MPSETIKAIVFSQPGGPEVLEYKDVPKPVPGKGQILVKNFYSGVNFIDTYHRSGLYKVPLPFIPGREASGVVEAIGEDVTGIKPGDRVAYTGQGTYAEYSLAGQDETIILPDTVSFEEGAAILIQGLTAESLVRLVYNVQPGDYVLIHAAAGGTGRLLVQLSKIYGAIVIGTTSTPEKAETAKKAGADHIILYTQQDVPTEVLKITGGKGVQVVYDGVGKSTFEASLASLAKLGTLASFGNASGKVDPVDIFKLTAKAIKLTRPSLFAFIDSREDFDRLATPVLTALGEKKLSILIHKVYDIKDAAQAHIDLAGRGTEGKLLIKL